jgi:ubiquinone/menaquinone biosynthesis C-methylase UbiE
VKTIISVGDFVDIYYKLLSSGAGRTFYRLLPSSNKKRTKKTWDSLNRILPTNWWSVPLVQNRWNKLITGNEEEEYPNYLVRKYLSEKRGLKLLSPGCGTGTKELKFANFKNFSSIEAFDLSPQRVEFANEAAKNKGVENINYSVSDAESFDYNENKYDVILFDSFLHHIKDLDDVLNKVYKSLKLDGLLVINEYVGPSRFQWSSEQLKLANEVLNDLPASLRKRWHNNKIKSKIYKPGLLRMILADPSEAVNSDLILSKIHDRFKVLEEKPLGGNILHLTLKDISQNFTSENEECVKWIQRLFQIEDEFLVKGNKTDFVFGVYSKQV